MYCNMEFHAFPLRLFLPRVFTFCTPTQQYRHKGDALRKITYVGHAHCMFRQTVRILHKQAQEKTLKVAHGKKCTALHWTVCTTCFHQVFCTFLYCKHPSRCLPDTVQHWPVIRILLLLHEHSLPWGRKERKKWRKGLKSYYCISPLTLVCFQQRLGHGKPFKDKQ